MADAAALSRLSKDKGVKNIIYVRVEDHGDCPHTDKAIITALKDFEIDILDWTKPDLCPKTIQEACPKVRKLYLTWSGLNGMLLAWGGRDGLANLEHLTDVYLRQTKVSRSVFFLTLSLPSLCLSFLFFRPRTDTAPIT